MSSFGANARWPGPRMIHLSVEGNVMFRPLLALAILWGAPALAAADDDWRQFRAASTGEVANPGLPTRWSATENVLWKSDLEGRGWSSPVVAGERVFLTTVVSEASGEEQKKGLYLGGERPEPSKAVHHWKVLCLDLTSGKKLWEQTVHEGVPQSSIHSKNTYASETTATDGERVYAYFGNLGVFCFTVEGAPVWQQRMPVYKTNAGWGTGASPVLDGDRLYVLNDNEEQSSLTALDKRTGQTVWQTPRRETSSWSTPFVWRHAGRTEIVASGSGRVRSYDTSGQQLWELGEMSGNAIPTPFAQGDLLYVCSGHVMGKAKPIVAVRPGATGDITPAKGKDAGDFVAWRQKAAAPYQPTPVLYQGRLYVLLDTGMMACYDAADGAELFGKTRIPEGRSFTASPWACDGKVFCLNEDGVTFVVGAGDKFELLYENRLAEDDMCLATPAAAGNKLLIRSSARLYCLAQGASVASK